MFKLIIPFLILLISTLNVTAQDKVSVDKKVSFNEVNKESVVSTIELTDFPNGLPAATKQYLENNASFMTYSMDGNKLLLSITSEKNERVIYSKFFYTLGIHEVLIKKGKEKGTYSIDDFLNLYNL